MATTWEFDVIKQGVIWEDAAFTWGETDTTWEQTAPTTWTFDNKP